MHDLKPRDRKRTINEIRQAIAQLEASESKVSISAVAKIAGITLALIHKTYPDLAEKIRGLSGKVTRSQRDAKHDALVHEHEVSRNLRHKLVAMRADLAKLASINQMLLIEVALAKGIASGKVVSILQPKGADV